MSEGLMGAYGWGKGTITFKRDSYLTKQVAYSNKIYARGWLVDYLDEDGKVITVPASNILQILWSDRWN